MEKLVRARKAFWRRAAAVLPIAIAAIVGIIMIMKKVMVEILALRIPIVDKATGTVVGVRTDALSVFGAILTAAGLIIVVVLFVSITMYRVTRELRKAKAAVEK